MTPKETYRLGRGEKDQPGWQVRVIPNKYPITDLHEVIIHSPDHEKDIDSLPLTQVELLLKAYRARYQFFKPRGQVLIFCNHGEHSGASLTHPHSQLVVIPSQINLDTLTREPLNNIVEENNFFMFIVLIFPSGLMKFGLRQKKKILSLVRLAMRKLLI